MHITLNFLGLLKEYIGESSVIFSLEQGADFGDVLSEIHHRYGERLPAGIWDPQKMEFKTGVLCVGEGRDLEERNTLLKDGEMISIAVHMAGG